MVPVQQEEQGDATMLERSLSLSTCCSVPHGIPPPSCCSGSCDICSETLRVPPWDTPPLLPPHADVAVPWSGADLRSASGPFEVWWNGMERAARGPWELVEVCVVWGGFVEGPVKLAHYNITQNRSWGLRCSPSAGARPHGMGWRVVWSLLRVLLSLPVSPNFVLIVCLVSCPVFFRFIFLYFSV